MDRRIVCARRISWTNASYGERQEKFHCETGGRFLQFRREFWESVAAMLIQKIEMIDQKRDESRGAETVTVCLHGPARRVFATCTVTDADLADGSDFSTVVALKVVHQLRRMPEFRTGQDALELDGNLVADLATAQDQGPVNKLAAQ